MSPTTTTKLSALADAVRAHVEPEMHLNWASTPSRSNAAVREVARQFRGRDPRFTVSATGFHSTAHLFPLLGLGARYITCFCGDNYPVPRPNALYEALARQGRELQLWSLFAYVSSLRAGALGQRYAVTTSLAGTALGDALAAAGMYHEVPAPAPRPGAARGATEEPPVGLITAMRADVAFLHAPMGDCDGNVVFAPPYSEGFWGALGARRGVIVTVERLVPRGVCARFPEAMRVPAHRVLAVCEAPFGSHPQPLYVPARFEVPGYRDDFDHYERWRAIAHEPRELARFESEVLDAPDPELAYRAWVGEARLAQLGASPPGVTEPAAPAPAPRARVTPSRPPIALAQGPSSRETPPDAAARSHEILVVLAARKIAERVLARGYKTLLAGIGSGYLAARMARLALAARGVDVKVMVETGIFDLECGPEASGFLLGHDNMARAARLSSVEHVLGVLACGADNRCLGVLGAAQVDPTGAINSTRIGARLLVGSGGANDVASCADEVLVLARCGRSRLVPAVEHATSPGRRVLHVVTDLCTFARESPASTRWRVADLYPAHGGLSREHALGVVRERCAWAFDVPAELEYAPAISTAEMRAVHTLDPRGLQWRREERGGQ